MPVKATLSVMNTEGLCYAACPLVVNGDQCDGAVSSNGYEWWNCDGCNMTFVACGYRYMIFVQLADSTGEIYATTSQEVGEKIFGQTARELYLMKYEKQDHAQYNKIVMGVQNCEYLFDVKSDWVCTFDIFDELNVSPFIDLLGLLQWSSKTDPSSLLNLHESTQNDRRKPTQAGERKNRLNSLH
jgi:transcriptional antiterminator Rof (Rho-off)